MSNKVKVTTPEVWMIRHKETGEYWQAPSGKTSWKKKNHAANAWACLCNYSYTYLGKEKAFEDASRNKVEPICEVKKDYKGVTKEVYRFPYFKEQDVWECVNVLDNPESKIEQLVNAINNLQEDLGECLPIIYWDCIYVDYEDDLYYNTDNNRSNLINGDGDTYCLDNYYWRKDLGDYVLISHENEVNIFKADKEVKLNE